MLLSKYTSDTRHLNSVLKNVPLKSENHYAEARKLIWNRCKLLNALSSFVEVKPRFVFRGPRYYGADSTLKEDAHSFDVYLQMKTKSIFNFSRSQKLEIQEIAREQFQALV